MLQYTKFLFLVFGVCSLTWAGFGRGNGGDSVFCRPSLANELSGNYSLDFILTQTAVPSVEIRSWKESADRILKLLQKKSPYLADSFLQFLKYQDNYTNYHLPRIWESSTWGLKKLSTHSSSIFFKRLPPNCMEDDDTGNPGEISVRQTVIRLERPDSIIYQYDSSILNDLLAHRPLQMSFLMVHEWLWDISNDVEALRRFNYLLHSPQLELMTPEELYLAIDGLGLRNSTDFVGVCARSAAVRAELEAIESNGCEKIKEFSSTHKRSELELIDPKAQALKNFDLHGLSGLRKFSLRARNLKFLPEWMFSGSPGLRELRLELNSMREFYPRVFEDLALNLLWIKGKHFIHFPDGIFSFTRQLSEIVMVSVPGSSLSTELFADVPGLKSVSLIDIGFDQFPFEMIDNAGAVKFNLCASDHRRTDLNRVTKRYGSRVSFSKNCQIGNPVFSEPHPRPLPPLVPPTSKARRCDGTCADAVTEKEVGAYTGYGAHHNEAYRNLVNGCDHLCGADKCVVINMWCKPNPEGNR